MTRTLGLTFAGAVAAAVLAFGVANASPATSTTLDSLRSVGDLAEHDRGGTLASLPSSLLAPPWSLALPASLPPLVVMP